MAKDPRVEKDSQHLRHYSLHPQCPTVCGWQGRGGDGGAGRGGGADGCVTGAGSVQSE